MVYAVAHEVVRTPYQIEHRILHGVGKGPLFLKSLFPELWHWTKTPLVWTDGSAFKQSVKANIDADWSLVTFPVAPLWRPTIKPNALCLANTGLTFSELRQTEILTWPGYKTLL